MKYKAILLDVDGTIVPVGPNTKPSVSVSLALKKAKGLVNVCLVSGRCLGWLEELFQILDLDAPCIINGGSQIIDPKTKEILWERPINKASLEEILKIISVDNIPFIISDDGIEYKNPTNLEFSKPLAVKLTFFKSKEESDLCVKQLLKIPNISAHKTYSWDKDKNYKLEIYITHSEATKQQATQELAKLLNIKTSEIIAVGDARNDAPLLNACGLKIAMGNADDKLKIIADYIAPTVDEDGVAHVVKKFIL